MVNPKRFSATFFGKEFLAEKLTIALPIFPDESWIEITTVFMRGPDHNPSRAAGHTVFAMALGLSLLMMLALMMAGH